MIEGRPAGSFLKIFPSFGRIARVAWWQGGQVGEVLPLLREYKGDPVREALRKFSHADTERRNVNSPTYTFAAATYSCEDKVSHGP